jgi:ferredoxin-NADP reductase
MKKTKNFILSDSRMIGKQTLLISLRPKSQDDELDFLSGQYVSLSFIHNFRPSPARCFSIVSSPYDRDKLMFAMRINGDYTKKIKTLPLETKFLVNGPFGDFVIDENVDKHLFLIAAGIGIAPFISMIKYLTQIKSKITIALFYSNTTQDNIPFYEELMQFTKINPNFKVIFFISNGPIDPEKKGIFISDYINIKHIKRLTRRRTNSFTYFICGPNNFIHSINHDLLLNGVKPEKIIVEQFTNSNQISSISNLPNKKLEKNLYLAFGAVLIFGFLFISTIDNIWAIPKIQSLIYQQNSNSDFVIHLNQNNPNSIYLHNNHSPITSVS